MKGTQPSVPHVRVLLATFNGQRWLDDQLSSIFGQQDVRPTVVASDDSSSDGTPALLERWRTQADLTVLPTVAYRFGSAHRNFLRLIRDADAGDADYVALADQDDIWLDRKLARAIECLCDQKAAAYSSNVVAFWPDGRRRLIDKAQPQRAFDHLFGSPGPGCTFVLTRTEFDRLQSWVSQRFDDLQGIWVHDWLIYAFVRDGGGRWIIDRQANMLYRQHGGNEIGVNAGWRAAINRLQHVRSGSYRRTILLIADALDAQSAPIDAVRRLSWIDRVWLITRVRQFRRRVLECLFLACFLMVMPGGDAR